MSKFFLAATAIGIAATSAIPAQAGNIYANVEANSSFEETSYQSTQTDIHLGYKGGSDSFGWYILGGPQLDAVQGKDGDSSLSAKGGFDVKATEKLDLYAELSTVRGDKPTYGTKVGATFNF